MVWCGTALTPDSLINGLDKISQFPILPDLPPPCLPSAGKTDQEYAARSHGLCDSTWDVQSNMAFCPPKSANRP